MKFSTTLKKEQVDALAIGCFDGIHVGHKQLLKRLGKNGALFVVDKDNASLTPAIKRNEYTNHPCMFFHFLKLKHLSGEEFVALLKKEFVNLKKIVVGYDFLFGHNRSCDANDLKRLFDGEVEIVEEFCCCGTPVHSRLIRSYLKEGKIVEANRFLGREYAIMGEIIKGQGLGKKELFPTLNLLVLNYLTPKEGVYATRTRIGKRFYNSVSFVGIRLSTDGEFSIETHIIDADIGEVEGVVELFFVAYVRENQKFDDLSLLKNRIEEDIEIAKKELETCRLFLSDYC